MEVVESARNILKDKYDDMVGVFINNSLEYIEELSKALEENNIEALIRPSHTLKSTCRQMGAFKLSELAKNVEHTAKTMQQGEQSLETVKGLKVSIASMKMTLSETKTALEKLAA